MLKGAKLVAFAATADASRAAAFYMTVLGLKLRYEDDFAVSLDCEGVEVRLQKVERFDPQPFTALGWQVANITEVAERLLDYGVVPERYPWLDQDRMGVWQAPSGARVAWFRDPDGNLLSIAQYAAG